MLTTEAAKAILTKVTTLPEGLFEETMSRAAGAISMKRFYCDVEGDDYEMLIDAKDEVITIKNGDFTWTREAIKAALAAPIPTAPMVPTTPGVASTVQMPVPIPAVINFSLLKIYLVDFIKVNPGCISSLDPVAYANEASTHSPGIWELASSEGDEDYTTFSFYASNCSEQEIADNVSAEVKIDCTNGEIVEVTING